MKKSMTFALSIVSMLAGALAGGGVVEKIRGEKLKQAREISNKRLALFHMMNQWVKVKQEGKNLSSYFERYGYKRIAIYGMSYAGQTLIQELKGTEIQVAYGIDKRADYIYSNVEIVFEEDSLEEVDIIVVTAITFFDKIVKEMNQKVNCPIVSLEDILCKV